MSKYIVSALMICFALFSSLELTHAATVTTTGVWHNGNWHPNWYTSYNDVEIGGGRNDGHKIIYATNSSTHSTTTSKAVACLYAWEPGCTCVPTGTYDEYGNEIQKDCTKIVTTTTYFIDHLYCPAGEALVDNQQNRSGLARSDTLTCMVRDDLSPTIMVDLNGYVNDTWTNANVKVDVEVKDDGLGLKKTWYIVNGTKTDNAGSSFSIPLFTEEGKYDLTIGAEDNSTHIGADGTPTSNGNIGEFHYVIKIDKTGPMVTTPIVPSGTWGNAKPIVPVVVEDKYKGQPIVLKEFTCTGISANATWNLPASAVGKIKGSCDPGVKNCNIDSNFSQNLSNCSWTCDDGYEKGSDNICHISSKQFACPVSILPVDMGIYDKDNVYSLISTGTVAEWTGPIGIGTDGIFTSKFVPGTPGTYAPAANTGSCAFDCGTGFHYEGSNCVNDAKSRCCPQLPLSKSIGGTWVDCTILTNQQNNRQCQVSELCGGYVKEVLGVWNDGISDWEYNTENVTTKKAGEVGFGEHCGAIIFAHSNGVNCHAKYYLINSAGGQPVRCDLVPVGEYSGSGENIKHPCTNKPANSTYTSNGSNNNCSWTCDANYNKNGGNCDPDTRLVSCDAKPNNTNWNNGSSNYTQTWSGSVLDWLPVRTTEQRNHPDPMTCSFDCELNYTWDGGSSVCIPDTRQILCDTSWLDSSYGSNKNNYEWYNGDDKFSQTWDGSQWLPWKSASHNNSPSSECEFKCKSGKTWNWGNKKCQ